jgi:lipopolysaccharide biosynthesis protein
MRSLLEQLDRLGYRTVLVSTSPSDTPLDWRDDRRPSTVVLRRPNLGYDFGSWATAMERYPAIRTAPVVLLMNDSLIGPFAPIDRLLERFHRSRADAWAMTDTQQLGHHLQSYALGFRDGVLDRASMRAFWDGIRVEASRDDVIRVSELGLSQLLRRHRFTTGVAIEGWRAVDGDDNPTIIGWRRLLDLGFPFLKRQVLLEPGVCPDGAEAPAELRRRFGIEVSDWL